MPQPRQLPLTPSQRLVNRIREELFPWLPEDARIERCRYSREQMMSGAWSWRLISEVRVGLSIGSTERVTNILKYPHLVLEQSHGDTEVYGSNKP